MVKPKTSPVYIQIRNNKLQVESRETGDLLACCFLGDEAMVESIADSLSARRLGKDAEKVRRLVEERRPRLR
jgi:hypothetical protein